LKRKLLLYLLLAILILGGLAAYVGWNARRELNAARGILATSVDDLTEADIAEAEQHLEAADGYLGGWAATLLRMVPVARQNIQAVDAVVDAGLPVLDDARALTDARELVTDANLVSEGRVRLEELAELRDPLSDQLASLTRLERELESHRSGWLLPPLWDAVDEFERRAEELRQSVRSADDALAIASPMLGANGPRTYLVVLINNAELRGAGGLLSGVGSITANDGRIELGPFFYQGDLRTKPPQSVDAPPDFERRFGRYRANTTVWVNTSASPDVPEVATVAARLFADAEHVSTDGAIIMDPRGIESLLPPSVEIPVVGTNVSLTNEDFTDFVYSDSYEVLGGGDPRRKAIVLGLGRAAFQLILGGGVDGSEMLDSAAAALRAGHLRFVSFDSAEQEVLDRLGVTGSLKTAAVDNLLVTVQNLGADKLDYWMRRHIAHDCDIDGDSARCETMVELSNETPEGLNEFVTQASSPEKRGHPYGTYIGYLEVYVPERAELDGVTLDGRAAPFFPETEDDRRSIGMYFSTLRRETTRVRVVYELELDDTGYSLEVSEQPLAFDATVDVTVRGPQDWIVTGPGTQNEGTIRFDGNLDGALRFEVRPAGATGITSLWRTLVEFWTQPLG
jgi:Protein of unknown function (DUF4012)